MSKCSCIYEAYGMPDLCKEKCLYDEWDKNNKDKLLSRPRDFEERRIILVPPKTKEEKL